jgi:hypothetical protein
LDLPLPSAAQDGSTDFKGGFMNNRRAKIAAGATVLGLGALGGAALGTNHGIPTAQQVAGNGGSGAIVTSASGATAASQPIAVSTNPGTRPPIVTRASGGGLPGSEVDD